MKSNSTLDTDFVWAFMGKTFSYNNDSSKNYIGDYYFDSLSIKHKPGTIEFWLCVKPECKIIMDILDIYDMKEKIEDAMREVEKSMRKVYGEDCPTNQMPELNKIRIQMNLKKGKFKMSGFCMYVDGDHFFFDVDSKWGDVKKGSLFLIGLYDDFKNKARRKDIFDRCKRVLSNMKKMHLRYPPPPGARIRETFSSDSDDPNVAPRIYQKNIPIESKSSELIH